MARECWWTFQLLLVNWLGFWLVIVSFSWKLGLRSAGKLDRGKRMAYRNRFGNFGGIHLLPLYYIFVVFLLYSYFSNTVCQAPSVICHDLSCYCFNILACNFVFIFVSSQTKYWIEIAMSSHQVILCTCCSIERSRLISGLRAVV